MSVFSIEDGVYPSGQCYMQVSLAGIRLGHLTESAAGYSSVSWKKPVVDKAAALEKLRAAAIVERKRQIAALQVEIEKLAEA